MSFHWRRVMTMSTACALFGSLVLVIACCGQSAAATVGHKSSKLAPGVANAEANLAQIEKAFVTWTGPRTGPKMAKGKSIVIVSEDLSNESQEAESKAIASLAKQWGWKPTQIDGQGTTTQEQAAMSQAIALKPDVIVASTLPTALIPSIRSALHDGIPVVCTSIAPTPGPWKSIGCDTNIFENYNTLGEAMGDWAIVQSGGHLNGILMSDKTYAVVTAKTSHVASQFKAMGCTGCKLVLSTQVPFADEATTLPTLLPAWLQKYGKPLWLFDPSDVYAATEVPTLKSLGVSPSDVPIAAFDGDPADIRWIRSGTYQVMDVGIPEGYLAYQVLDNANRLLNNAPLSNPQTPIWIVDHSNVNEYGEKNGVLVAGGNYAQHFSQLWKTGKTS